ncbi:MAG TPA: 3-mercaptopyruvate sulfurtransferase [Gemmatimonadales bacterium]
MPTNLGPIVSGDWLQANLRQPGVVVLDASWYLAHLGRDPRREYLGAHVPGALFYDLDAISDPGSLLPHMFGTPERFAEKMGELGVGDDDLVVTYDGSGANLSAARAWWTFKVFGHDRVAVLDGGFITWQHEGRPVESGPVLRSPARFTPRYRPGLVRSLDEVRAILGSGSEQVVDARSAGRYSGREPEPRPGLRSGHMPGSRNLPYPELVGLDGRLLDRERLTARLRAAGIDLDRPIVTSCGSGVTACALLLVLDHLGHSGHALYDGSWSEWGGPIDTPVVEGAGSRKEGARSGSEEPAV